MVLVKQIYRNYCTNILILREARDPVSFNKYFSLKIIIIMAAEVILNIQKYFII